MIRATVLALLATALLSGAAGAAEFRIAAVTPTAGGCDKGLAARIGGEAYVKHLQQRLNEIVILCGYATEAEALRALADGKVDLATSSQAGYPAVRDKVRAILTPRPAAGPSRGLAMALVAGASPRTAPSALTGAVPIFVTTGDLAHDAPLAGLRAAGADVAALAPEVIAGDLAKAAASLRAGRGDVLILYAGHYQRLCRPDAPGAKPCGDLKEIWRGRPAATEALVIRRDLSSDRRFQLIGIHIALHLENKAAFAFAARNAPGAGSFDATEADALVAKR